MKVNKPKLVLSTIGTSLLTQASNFDERKHLNSISNKLENELSPNDIELISKTKATALASLEKGISFVRQASAELNGIGGIYPDISPINDKDQHILIATDTYIGMETANIVYRYLTERRFNVNSVPIPNLSTRSKSGFSDGIKFLLKFCDETLPGYHEVGYEIIFNLTGGFKSLQGVLNTVGMFYADKIMYIFETANELLEIPRLPVQIDQEVFKNNAKYFLLLSEGYKIEHHIIADIPETLIDSVDDIVMLSVWGELLWNNVKKDILSSKLIELPYIKFEESFKRDFNSHQVDTDKVKLMETLAKIANLLKNDNGNIRGLKADGGILYEDMKNNRVDGNPIGHFRITQSIRASCMSENGFLKLRHFGNHDYVNNNP